MQAAAAARGADDDARLVRAWLLRADPARLRHGAGRRRDAADGIRAFHHRVEARDAASSRRLSEAAWREAFDLYRQSPQYELLNPA